MNDVFNILGRNLNCGMFFLKFLFHVSHYKKTTLFLYGNLIFSKVFINAYY